MTIMHHLLAGALRFAGRSRDAAEVESAAQPEPARGPVPVESIPPSEPLPSTPAIVPHDAEHEAHGATSHESGGTSLHAAEAGGRSSDDTVAQTRATGGGDSLGSGQVDSGQEADAEHGDPEHAEDHDHQEDTHAQHIPPTSESHALHDDPLAGIYSERFRARLEREAFVGASSTAQDSAIVQTADRLLPAEVRGLLQHDVPNIDISTAARSARIAGLGGEMPAWAQLELFKDPAHARSVEAAAPLEHPAHAATTLQPETSQASTGRTNSSTHGMER